MTTRLRERLLGLRGDDWRSQGGFSEDFRLTQEAMWANAGDEVVRIQALNDWITRWQPCVFGKLAAKTNAITYCSLTEADLLQSDESVYARIQDRRNSWKTAGYRGESSAFIIHILSERLALARPDDTVFALASEVCRLYLISDSITYDTIYLDNIELEIPTSKGGRASIEFDVGVNYFSAHGDGRWWQDHRIPGGIALSMNSVGHMALSGRLRQAVSALLAGLDQTPDAGRSAKPESLGEALRLAMQTIANASQTPWGPATRLIPISEARRDGTPRCPIDLPKGLAGKDHCSYEGFYHTDVTFPKEYFVADVGRSDTTIPRSLDFTYLFDDRLDNPAFVRMGRGIRVRGVSPVSEGEELGRYNEEALRKRSRARGRAKGR